MVHLYTQRSLATPNERISRLALHQMLYVAHQSVGCSEEATAHYRAASALQFFRFSKDWDTKRTYEDLLAKDPSSLSEWDTASIVTLYHTAMTNATDPKIKGLFHKKVILFKPDSFEYYE